MANYDVRVMGKKLGSRELGFGLEDNAAQPLPCSLAMFGRFVDMQGLAVAQQRPHPVCGVGCGVCGAPSSDGIIECL